MTSIMTFLSISVRQLHRDFVRAGADVCQALTFYASESIVEWRTNQEAGIKQMPSVRHYIVFRTNFTKAPHNHRPTFVQAHV